MFTLGDQLICIMHHFLMIHYHFFLVLSIFLLRSCQLVYVKLSIILAIVFKFLIYRFSTVLLLLLVVLQHLLVRIVKCLFRGMVTIVSFFVTLLLFYPPVLVPSIVWILTHYLISLPTRLILSIFNRRLLSCISVILIFLAIHLMCAIRILLYRPFPSALLLFVVLATVVQLLYVFHRLVISYL